MTTLYADTASIRTVCSRTLTRVVEEALQILEVGGARHAGGEQKLARKSVCCVAKRAADGGAQSFASRAPDVPTLSR
jgi:hypothetical protein